MERVRLIAPAATMALLGVFVVSVGAQQTPQDRTFITFSSAVEMPGVVLEPGTYEFRLAETLSRNVVQVLSRDRNEVMGQWTFVQSERERVSDETVVMFRETAEGTRPAVQYWYYPGEKIGKEFIYPKDQAERIAARTGQQVRSDDGVVAAGARPDGAADLEARADVDVPARTPQTDARASVTTPRDAEVAVRTPAADAQASATTPQRDAEVSVPAPQADARASVTTPQPGAGVTAQTQTPSAGVSASSQRDDDAGRPVGTAGVTQAQRVDELPRTASPLALIGLLGLLSLVGAFGIRRFSR